MCRWALGLVGWSDATGAADRWQQKPAGLLENAARAVPFLLYLRRLLVAVVVAANVNPLPARTGWDPRPAGASVVVDWTTEPERKEIAIVESMMEVIVVMPRHGSAPSVNSSGGHRRGGHRATTDWAHISAIHH